MDDDSKNALSELLEQAKKMIDEPLPSKPTESTPVIDLELGIPGVINSDPSVTQDVDNQWKECSKSALIVSKQWRRAFKLYRKQNRLVLKNMHIHNIDFDVNFILIFYRISGIKKPDDDN